MAYGFQKDSPYVDLFNYFLKEMDEKGILTKIHKKYKNHQQFCPDLGGKPLGFEGCIMAFIALLGGIGICLILMSVECFSKLTKVNIPWLDMYDRKDKILPDPLLTQLNVENHNLKEEIKLLKRRCTAQAKILKTTTRNIF